MKLPTYVKISMPHLRDGQIVATVRVKWWGWFPIVYEAMTRESELPWYKWLVYPKVCLKAIWNNTHAKEGD